MTNTGYFLLRGAALAILAGAAVLPSSAQAWWRGGVFIGGPIVVGPPVVAYPQPYAYPPAYYAPGYPPAYYAPGYAPPPPAYPQGYQQPNEQQPNEQQPGEQQPGEQQQSEQQQPNGQQEPVQTPSPELSQANTPFGSTCYAGVYVCAAPAQTHIGVGCSCPGIGAPSFGVVQ